MTNEGESVLEAWKFDANALEERGVQVYLVKVYCHVTRNTTTG